MTYSELKTNIGNWLNRSDLTSVIPTFVTLAESRLNRQLRTTDQYTRSTLTTADNYLSMPDDFLEMSHLRTTAPKERELLEIGTSQINEANDSNFTASLPDTYPRYYVFHQTLRVFPAPTESIDYEMYYYAKVPALNDSTQTTNWLIDSHPDAYLYYSLLAAEPYLGSDERIPVWQSFADRAVAEVQGSSERRKNKGSRHVFYFEAIG